MCGNTSSSTCVLFVSEYADFGRPLPALHNAFSRRASLINTLTNFLHHTELFNGYAQCSHYHPCSILWFIQRLNSDLVGWWHYLCWSNFLNVFLRKLSKLTAKQNKSVFQCKSDHTQTQYTDTHDRACLCIVFVCGLPSIEARNFISEPEGLMWHAVYWQCQTALGVPDILRMSPDGSGWLRKVSGMGTTKHYNRPSGTARE